MLLICHGPLSPGGGRRVSFLEQELRRLAVPAARTPLFPWPASLPAVKAVAVIVDEGTGALRAPDAPSTAFQRELDALLDADPAPPLYPVRVGGDWAFEAPDELRRAEPFDLAGPHATDEFKRLLVAIREGASS